MSLEHVCLSVCLPTCLYLYLYIHKDPEMVTVETVSGLDREDKQGSFYSWAAGLV